MKPGYILSSLLLLISYLLIFHSTNRLRKQSRWLSESNAIAIRLDKIILLVTEAETSVRGYVITKDSSFLKLYFSACHDLPEVYTELKGIIPDDPAFQKRVDSLRFLTNKRFETFSSGIERFQKAGLQITKEMEQQRPAARANMDSIRQMIGRMSDTEHSVARQRTSNLSNFFNNADLLTAVSLLLAIAAIAYSLYTYSRENAKKEEANQKAENYNRDLEASIKQLRRLNAELEELKSIEKFAATGRVARTIAHEVRNPLTNISLATEQLQEVLPREGESEELITIIERNAQRIHQLVTELLDATKFAQLSLQSSHINQLLDETVELAKDRIDLNHIQVIRDYHPDLGNVLVDPEKTRIAFLNIIVNAIEAMEKGKGVLQIITKKEDNKCVVEIKDNGSGMDEKTLKNIFEPYFTNKITGNGLGLTNTQNIILNHKGILKVISQPGHGSVFIITLELSPVLS